MFLRLLSAAALIGVLAACGSGKDDTAAPPAMTVPDRGTLLVSPPPQKSMSTAPQLLAALTGGDAFTQGLLGLVASPKCGVSTYNLTYQSAGGKGEAGSSTAALMLPTGSDPACSGARPIVLYAHGTSVLKADSLVDLTNSANTEGVLIALIFASQGYIVVAPSYAGYDASTFSYHPYLVADQQSKDMIDALAAARTGITSLKTTGVTDSGKLFVTGYSQGGYVALATHRAMQAAGIAVTASAPMSGPYALSAFGDAIFQGQVSNGGAVNLTFLLTAYQKTYGNVYTNTTDVFEAPYATGIDTLLPGSLTNGDLVSQAKLPDTQVFSSTAPDPAYAAFTPATAPSQFAALFASSFGTSNLIRNDFRLNYLRDAAASPDGGFPVMTDGLPPPNPQFGLRIDLKTNDLRTWAPTAPVLLCGGENDPTVFYFNTQLMQSYWAAHAPSASVDVLNVDSGISIGGDYSDLKTEFATIKAGVEATAIAGGASDGGQAALIENYHSGVAPFCVMAAKRFFDSH